MPAQSPAAAEPVERRGGAKENADLQSAVRTQSREAVSQAQARIREAVTRQMSFGSRAQCTATLARRRLCAIADRDDVVLACGERIQKVGNHLESIGYLSAIARLVVASVQAATDASMTE